MDRLKEDINREVASWPSAQGSLDAPPDADRLVKRGVLPVVIAAGLMVVSIASGIPTLIWLAAIVVVLALGLAGESTINIYKLRQYKDDYVTLVRSEGTWLAAGPSLNVHQVYKDLMDAIIRPDEDWNEVRMDCDHVRTLCEEATLYLVRLVSRYRPAGLGLPEEDLEELQRLSKRAKDLADAILDAQDAREQKLAARQEFEVKQRANEAVTIAVEAARPIEHELAADAEAGGYDVSQRILEIKTKAAQDRAMAAHYRNNA